MSDTWVHDGIEITKTGRTASKTLGSGRKDVQVEITPKDEFNGKWKKWVRDTDLFKVDITDSQDPSIES